MIHEKILWFHYNKYSNPGTKTLWFINVIGWSIAAALTESSAIILSIICYIALLCDRGLGEPSYYDTKRAKLSMNQKFREG